MTCKTIGCNSSRTSPYNDDYCQRCFDEIEALGLAPVSLNQPSPQQMSEYEQGHAVPSVETPDPARFASGGNSDYYLVDVPSPKRLTPYQAECEDIIEALGMNFQEGEIFKAIWRKCAGRLGYGKNDDTALRNAEKISHYGERLLAVEQRLSNA